MAVALRKQFDGLLGPDFEPAHGAVIGTASPSNEEELASTVSTATAALLAVVPRGSASSPYAGAVAERGLLISFEHLNRVLDIDAARQEVTLEPGVFWQDLIDSLAPAGLAPRVFPSSRAFSTVGGFVAQGGGGVGSFEFGPVDGSVVSSRIIDASGRPRTVVGDDLDLVVGAEGRTGLLSRLTLRLQPAPDVAPVVGLFGEVGGIEGAIAACVEMKLPLWSLSYIDPIAAGAQGDHGGPRRPALEAGRHAVLFLCRSGQADTAGELRELIHSAGGTISQEVAGNDRWIDRFMGLQVLRTTPLPLQFRLPPGTLSNVVGAIPSEFRNEVGFEGIAMDHGEQLVVRFLFARRAFSPARNLELARLLLDVVKTAGGAPYASGAFFIGQAPLVYGSDRLRRLRRFHAEQDPRGLLNPGRAFRD